jgi:hypothetical protein
MVSWLIRIDSSSGSRPATGVRSAPAPGLGRAPVTTMRLVLAFPLRALLAQDPTIRCPNSAREPVLDVVPEPVVAGELGDLRTPAAPLGLPLRDRRLVLEPERGLYR